MRAGCSEDGEVLMPNCPNPQCLSKSTQPLSMALSTGTRRRSTVGISRRGLWTSGSTYRSDFVSSLPAYPTNYGAYLCLAVGSFLAFLGYNTLNVPGAAVVFFVLGGLLILGGLRLRKSGVALSAARDTWQRTWVCKRCGQLWTA